MKFKLSSAFKAAADQPRAIKEIVESIKKGNKNQTLEGVTGSGKTFTMACVIEKLQRPTLIISHNKTLAAQLYSEFKEFFPENAVEYFVSYYDYYQPEAYIASTDTFIEKDSSINDELDRLRIAASSSLLSRNDTIVIASVSCIYGLGSPEDFKLMMIPLKKGLQIERDVLLKQLIDNRYSRNDIAFERSTFRARGDVVDIFPSYMKSAIRVEFFGDEIDSVRPLDPITGKLGKELEKFDLYPATQYITQKDKLQEAIKNIKNEMKEQVDFFEKQNKLIEAQRIKMRTLYDLEMLEETGFCTGIENYSRQLAFRKEGSRPQCLIDFFPEDFLTFIDESHVSLPQIRAMYNGDRARKERLVEFGFRLPSALDNRPLKFDEFDALTPSKLFVSATPSPYEIEKSDTIIRQIIRPTGLLDPEMHILPTKGQVEDLIGKIKETVAKKQRVLVTTLTKVMSEDICQYLKEFSIKVEYLHSSIDAIERVEILRSLREAKVDVLIGVNLLREGLDLPEVSLVAILDADKEGFLRSETSIIQTAGRAARHEEGKVILYADTITGSMQRAIEKTSNRRKIQLAYNKKHNITPKSVIRPMQKSLHIQEPNQDEFETKNKNSSNKNASLEQLKSLPKKELTKLIKSLKSEMKELSENLEFEKAAIIRDKIALLEKQKK